MSYDLKSVSLPRLEGAAISAMAGVLSTPVLGRLVMKKLLADAGVTAAREMKLDEAPTLLPERPHPESIGEPIAASLFGEVPTRPMPHLPRPRIRDYAAAYRAGRVTPETVAEHVLQKIEDSKHAALPLNAFIAVDRDDVRRQAKESAARHRDGRPLSIFDGVPVAIKDELDQAGYASTAGTAFLKTVAAKDSAIVARLRELGALLIGKTNMYEIGIAPAGANTTWGQARTPYNLQHDSGGSSSGSAAAVGAALCPVAIGCDGGGSIRVPAAHCGVVGLKATFGRISERGVVPLCWSVGHAGPIGASVEDVALTYAALAGADATVPETLVQPRPTLAGYDAPRTKGLRIGVYQPWFDHATKDIVAANRSALDKLVARGATVVDINLPELDAMRVAHVITILAEMAGSMRTLAPGWKGLSALVRTTLGITKAFTADDFVWAQRMRTRAMAHHARAFQRCDVIATPATAITAPKVPDSGTPWSDLSAMTEIMRFIIAGNFLGYPAIVVPVAYDAAGLPIGLQLMAPHWQEDLLLGVALDVERDHPVHAPGLSLSPLPA